METLALGRNVRRFDLARVTKDFQAGVKWQHEISRINLKPRIDNGCSYVIFFPNSHKDEDPVHIRSSLNFFGRDPDGQDPNSTKCG